MSLALNGEVYWLGSKKMKSGIGIRRKAREQYVLHRASVSVHSQSCPSVHLPFNSCVSICPAPPLRYPYLIVGLGATVMYFSEFRVKIYFQRR